MCVGYNIMQGFKEQAWSQKMTELSDFGQVTKPLWVSVSYVVNGDKPSY